MIKLTSEQTVQLDRNLGEAMEDLRTAVFGDEEATFLSVGANVGLALQKLHDIRVFLADQSIKEESKHKPFRESMLTNCAARQSYNTPQIEVPDPWRMSYDPK